MLAKYSCPPRHGGSAEDGLAAPASSCFELVAPIATSTRSLWNPPGWLRESDEWMTGRGRNGALLHQCLDRCAWLGGLLTQALAGDWRGPDDSKARRALSCT